MDNGAQGEPLMKHWVLRDLPLARACLCVCVNKQVCSMGEGGQEEKGLRGLPVSLNRMGKNQKEHGTICPPLQSCLVSSSPNLIYPTLKAHAHPSLFPIYA